MFFYLPITNYLTRLFHTIKEMAADDKVVSITGKPLELASAMVKVSTHNRNLRMSVSIKGKDGIENRIKRLLGEDTGKTPLPSIKTVLISFVMAMFLLSIPIVAVSGFNKNCDDDKCKLTHHHKSEGMCEPMAKDMDCNEHCYMNPAKRDE